jgi:XRE family transcriptional regulator, regulator of sulfur utilization
VPLSKPTAENRRFGKNLRQLHKDRGFTQERLAETAEVDIRYLRWLESGQSWPSLQVLGRLKKALDCDWGDLLEGCEP